MAGTIRGVSIEALHTRGPRRSRKPVNYAKCFADISSDDASEVWDGMPCLSINACEFPRILDLLSSQCRIQIQHACVQHPRRQLQDEP